MKKAIIKSTSLFLTVWILSTSIVSATSISTKKSTTSYTDLFQVDDSFTSDFDQMEFLEKEIKNNNIGDYKMLVKTNPTLLAQLGLSDVKSQNSTKGTQAFTMDDMDWGSFAWGLLCCPIGFFVVVTNKQKTQDQKTSFWIGWGVGAALNLLYYAIAGTPDYN